MPHNPVRDVVCVQLRCHGLVRRRVGGERRERVVFPDCSYTPHDFGPGDRRDVLLNMHIVSDQGESRALWY